MCGIWALLGTFSRPEAEAYLSKLNGRGPESRQLQDISGGYLGFTRLAINGLNEGGMQPFSCGGVRWICNGEIYNARQLSQEYNIQMTSGSDCEVLGPLYKHFRDNNNLPGFFRALDGVFALILLDEERGERVWGRDPYGVRPMFAAWKVNEECSLAQPNEVEGIRDFGSLSIRILLSGGSLNGLCLSSERKAIPDDYKWVIQFAPGSYATLKVPDLKSYYEGMYHTAPWVKNPMYSPSSPNGLEEGAKAVRFALEEAVRKRMMTERPCAALLSGGIDSSLIASLVQKNLKGLGLPALKTFSIGMPGSTDLAYARKVADWIGSDHTEVVLTADDFFAAIPEVIRDIESYDITTVRASVGNWLVSKAIRDKCDCKVVFNGDGSDEVFGSYMYFYKAPSDGTFEDEVGRLLSEIYLYDVLRSDRSISSHGLEPRTPFLDKQFVNVCRSVATCWRRPIKGKQIEKYLLRKAFDDGVTLPSEVLWRQKEAFSDGVSSKEKSWFQEIQERVVRLVENWQEKALDYTYLTPTTAEAYYYRSIYETLYGSYSAVTAIPAFWMPRWSPGATDPSARTLAIYSEACPLSSSSDSVPL
jgi:asparagine synthase (glutamine-hydrolysing)